MLVDEAVAVMRRWVLRNRVRGLFGLPPLPPPHASPVPPVPRVVLSLRAALPGALVRLVPGVLVLVVAALVGFADGWWLVAGAVGLWLVLWPRPVVAAGMLGLAGLWLLGDGDVLAADPVTGVVPGVWRLAGLVLAVHLLLVATALAAHVAWRALVEGAVLVRAARSVLVAQAVAQSTVLLTAWLRAGVVGQQESLRLIAVVAVVLVALVAVPRDWLTRSAAQRRLRRD